MSNTTAPATTATPTPSTETPLKQIYDQINALFGNGTNDIFQLEFPARLLEEGNYKYDGSDTINAQQVKPPAVAEAEFRLSDDMYDISNIVGGANGSSVAEKYRELVFSLFPSAPSTLSSSSDLSRKDDQERITLWLEEEVPDFDPPVEDLLEGIPSNLGIRAAVPAQFTDNSNGAARIASSAPSSDKKISRVDLYQKLLDLYTSERFRWVKFKNDARPTDFSKQAEVDAYDRLLSTYAPVIDAKLEALWTVLIVRAQYHRVRQYIGYIDVESASETLLRAKESLRASVTRSIDDSEDIYPVVFTPSNWAKYLSTNFKPEDLLNNIDTKRNQLFEAEKNRAMLINRKNVILAGQQDIKALQTAEQNARADLTKAQNDMVAGYSDTAMKLVQLYFNVVQKKSTDAVAALKSIEVGDATTALNTQLQNNAQPPLTQDQFKKLRDMQVACLQKQATLQTASESYTRAQLAASQARGNDGTNLLAQIQDQIDSLTMDIDYYKQVLDTQPNALGTSIEKVDPSENPKVDTTGSLPPSRDSVASVWQEIVVDFTRSTSASTNLSSTSVSQADYDTGFWFWSSSGSSTSSSSSSSKTHSTSNTDIKVAFRVMKVEMQRPWMNAGLLAQTGSFFRSDEAKVSVGKPADVKSGLASAAVASEDCILPSFATGFVVAKDVHIVLTSSEEFDSATVSDMQSSSNSGGGFLCFGCSKSESSSDHREGAVVTSSGNNLSIKIAAPQIIGWICELSPEDKTQRTYNPLGDQEFVDRITALPTNLPPSPPHTPK